MKRIMLFFGLAGTLAMFVARYSVDLNICTRLDYSCRSILDTFENVAYFFPVFLFFSLVTFKMKDSVFNMWWKFARIAIPIILVISTVINLKLHHTNSGFFNMDNMFDIPAHILMYAIFILGSLIQIWRGYRAK